MTLLFDTVGIAPERDAAIAGVWYGDRLVYQDTALTTIANTGDPVGGFAPVQGSLPAFVQGTAGRRPIRQNAAVVFDGSDDILSYTGNTLMNALSRTVIAVVSAAAAAATRPLFGANGLANWYVGQTGGSAPNGRMISSWQDAGAVGRNLLLGNGVFDGMPHVYAWRHRTDGVNVTVEHFLDWTLVASSTRTDGMNATAHSTWNLGAFAVGSLNGAWTVYALALWASAISDALLNGVVRYWKDRFRI